MKKGEVVIFKSFNGHNVALPNQILGFYHYSDNPQFHHYIDLAHIEEFFKGWYKGYETFKKWIAGEPCNNAPCNYFITFDYDPMTGEKIDWDVIRGCYLNN